MKGKYIILIYKPIVVRMMTSMITILVFLSCTSIIPFSNTGKQKRILRAWEQTMDSGKAEVKAYWQKLVNSRKNGWAYFKEPQNANIDDGDVAKLKLVPVPVYTIDSVNFRNFNAKQSPETIMKLDTRRALYYAMKDGEFVAVIYSNYENGTWKNGGGYSGIFKSVSNRLSELYDGNKLSCFYIYVSPHSHITYEYQFLAYTKDGEYRSIKMDKTPLLRDELINLQKRVYSQSK